MVKLNHPPFDAWLLSDEPLSPQQAYDLQEHLRICETCRQVEGAWNQVEHLMRGAGILAPVAGFSERWQTRLAAQRARHHRRQSWLFFLGVAALALIVLATLVAVLILICQSPAQFFFGLVYRLALVVEALGVFGFYMSDLTRTLPGIPFFSIFFFAGFATLFCVLWLVAFKQLTGVRRWVA